ncbi:hypothetical protein MLD38_014685 [Melastoma candidum]|uniref:Uncharacterized protein n=1 Tax=Melastoma candidum TaxID=119954 RepID=A0ACB9RGN7_9MYRT|nr:hypothetical protein MLD38_014685 [Melastoma candidum]
MEARVESPAPPLEKTMSMATLADKLIGSNDEMESANGLLLIKEELVEKMMRELYEEIREDRSGSMKANSEEPSEGGPAVDSGVNDVPENGQEDCVETDGAE